MIIQKIWKLKPKKALSKAFKKPLEIPPNFHRKHFQALKYFLSIEINLTRLEHKISFISRQSPSLAFLSSSKFINNFERAKNFFIFQVPTLFTGVLISSFANSSIKSWYQLLFSINIFQALYFNSKMSFDIYFHNISPNPVGKTFSCLCS